MLNFLSKDLGSDVDLLCSLGSKTAGVLECNHAITFQKTLKFCIKLTLGAIIMAGTHTGTQVVLKYINNSFYAKKFETQKLTLLDNII